MDLSGVVPAIARHAGIPDVRLVEQDLRLHLLLESFHTDRRLHGRLLFKGGTCLVKCYLDYPRFSMDLDFTWKDQEAWRGLGTAATRRVLRTIQRELVPAILAAAETVGLEPSADRGSVIYGASNRMMTVSLGFTGVTRLPGAVKVQVNFSEPVLWHPRRLQAASLLHGRVPRSLRAMSTDLVQRYARPVPVLASDAREILVEKCRAVLTRQAAHVRDVVDLFLIERELGLHVRRYRQAIITKTLSALGRERDREHLRVAGDRIEALLQADIRPLLLRPVQGEAFDAFRQSLLGELRELGKSIEAAADRGVPRRGPETGDRGAGFLVPAGRGELDRAGHSPAFQIEKSTGPLLSTVGRSPASPKG